MSFWVLVGVWEWAGGGCGEGGCGEGVVKRRTGRWSVPGGPFGESCFAVECVTRCGEPQGPTDCTWSHRRRRWQCGSPEWRWLRCPTANRGAQHGRRDATPHDATPEHARATKSWLRRSCCCSLRCALPCVLRALRWVQRWVQRWLNVGSSMAEFAAKPVSRAPHRCGTRQTNFAEDSKSPVSHGDFVDREPVAVVAGCPADIHEMFEVGVGLRFGHRPPRAFGEQLA